MTLPWNPGHLASRGGLARTRDSMGQIWDIPGNPGRVATLRQALSTASIPSRGPIIDSWYLLRYTSTFVEISWGVDSIFQSTFTIHIKFEHGTWTWTWSRPQPTRWCAVISFTSPQMHYSSMLRCKHFVENSVINSVIYGAFDYSRISMNHSYWLEVYKTTILVSFLLVLFFYSNIMSPVVGPRPFFTSSKIIYWKKVWQTKVQRRYACSKQY